VKESLSWLSRSTRSAALVCEVELTASRPPSVVLGRVFLSAHSAADTLIRIEGEPMDDVTVSQPGESITVIALHGEHDLATASEMCVLLDDAISGSNLVVVDVTSAQLIDSSFLHNLVKAHRGAQTRGSRFVLQMGTAPIVRRALEVSGLLEELECASSRDEALAKADL